MSRRLAVAVLASGMALVPLAGCSFSSDNVSCSGATCTMTLSGDGAKADVLGSTVSLGTIKNGTATLGVGSTSVSCTEGQTVTAGPLKLSCSGITSDAVTLTASLG